MATREEIEKQCWAYFVGKGLPEKSTAATMGNIAAESDFEPSLVERGSGIGFGLMQWSYERRTQLESYGTDLQHQLDFGWSEISTPYNTKGDCNAYGQYMNKSGYKTREEFLNGDGTLEELTRSFMACFERPGIPREEVRQKAAKEYFEKFSGTSVPNVSGGSVDPNTPNANSGSGQGTNYEMLDIEATNYEIVKNSVRYGDVLFGRRYRIIISDATGTGYNVSNLKVSFTCSKTMAQEPNMSIIQIYNMNVQTENEIIMNCTRITIDAGYEGSTFGTIFDGDIIQSYRYREDATTEILEIVAIDSYNSINFSFINFTMIKGQTLRSQVEGICAKSTADTQLGSISDRLGEQCLARGKVFFGNESDYMGQLSKSIEGRVYYENGAVNIIKVDELPEDEIIELTPKTGMLGTPEQTDFGVCVKSLINPFIKINSLIHVDNSYIKTKRIEAAANNIIANTSSNQSSNSAAVGDVRSKIIAEAKKLCDDPNVRYSQPKRTQTIDGITYYDCSSFVKHCYEVAGLDIVDVTWNQFEMIQKSGKFVTQELAKAGDIVLWGYGSKCTHVAIYDGEGGVYAARGEKYPADDQVKHHDLYGEPYFGVPEVLTEAESNSTNIPTVEDIKTSENKSTGGSKGKIAVRRGHQTTGGDGCASGILNEIDVANAYYKAVMRKLSSLGYDVLDVTPPEANRSMNDSLSYGVNKAKDFGAEYFISCHCNATDSHDADGCLVLYNSSNSKGKTLAENICSEISKLGFTNRGAQVSNRSLYEINHANDGGMTGIIIEPLFIDNQTDVNKLNSVGTDELAEAIVKGITGQSSGITTTDSNTSNTQQQSLETNSIYDNALYRALDRDGIYRVYKIEYSGDTRGNNWEMSVEAISQVGGQIPIIRG